MNSEGLEWNLRGSWCVLKSVVTETLGRSEIPREDCSSWVGWVCGGEGFTGQAEGFQEGWGSGKEPGAI